MLDSSPDEENSEAAQQVFAGLKRKLTGRNPKQSKKKSDPEVIEINSDDEEEQPNKRPRRSTRSQSTTRKSYKLSDTSDSEPEQPEEKPREPELDSKSDAEKKDSKKAQNQKTKP